MGDSSAYIGKYFFTNSKERLFTVLKYACNHPKIPICFIVITRIVNCFVKLLSFPLHLFNFKLNKYEIKI